MLKNKKRIILAIIAFLLVISTTCLAATTSSEKAKLEIVENNVCTINIQDVATFEKKLISSDLNKKELTLELKVTNTAEPIFNEPTEIFLVIDNSLSMDDRISNTTTRLNVVTDSAKNLALTLLKNENVKIGVVSFSTGEDEGTLTDATLKTKPTNDSVSVLTAIAEIAEGSLGPRTNIDAGLTLANQNFSADCESKYLILLTDGVPNTAVGGPTFTYSGEVATKTKATLQTISQNNVTIFSVMTGVPDVAEPTTGISYKDLAEEIFGTEENPTVGKFYYIPDTEIEKTICQTILSNFVDPNKNTLTNLSIHDYMPQEIIDNFDFRYATTPTLGIVSSNINLETNSITWTIPTLEPGASGTVSYVLTLKDNIDTSILDKVLNLTQKIEITADEIETDDGSNVLSSNVTPKVKVTIPKDDTIANTVIPQTGSTSTPMIIATILVVASIVIGIRFYLLNRDIK